MRGLREILLAVGLVVGMGVIAAPAVAATPGPSASVVAQSVSAAGDVNDFSFTSVHMKYTLTPGDDGTGHLLVESTYVANFTNVDTHRGIRIAVPNTFKNQPLRPSLISITDENGNERESETDTEDGNYLMTSRADDPVIGLQTYVITYTLDNVTHHYADRDVDEFYWDVLGTDSLQAHNNVTFELHTDPSLAEQMTGEMTCAYGAYGGSDNCTLRADSTGELIEAGPISLAPHEGFTVAVGFDPDAFVDVDTSYLGNSFSGVQLGMAGIGVVGFLGALIARRTALKDAPGRGVIIAQYGPPPGVDALNAAVILKRNGVGITAEIIEQAVRGSLLIGEKSKKGSSKYFLQLIDPSLAGDDNGHQLISALFGGQQPGAKVNLKSNAGLASRLDQILTNTAKAQDKGGVRKKPSGALRYLLPVILIIVGAAAMLIGALISVASSSPTGILVGVGVMVLAMISTALLAKRPYTEFGADLRDHLKGLKTFMQWAEADRIRMLQSPEGAERISINTNDPGSMLRLYEPLLPFAVVFGIEKEWQKNLKVYADAAHYAPGWYIGTTPFSAHHLTAGVASVSPAASSSSSGSGGGISVGGGGGGASSSGV